MAETSIEWATKVWNPVVGCSVISPGCTNCYAMRMAGRLERMGSPIYRGLTQKTKAGDVWTGRVEASNRGKMIEPLGWKKPARIFVNSMSDLFHENLADEIIDQIFAVMALCPQHTFMVLTKRADRMRAWFAWERDSAVLPYSRLDRICAAAYRLMATYRGPWDEDRAMKARRTVRDAWIPGTGFSNVWLGVSAEDQERAAERIPDLLATPAAKRFVSAEPLLGPIDFNVIPHPHGRGCALSPTEIAGGTGQAVDLIPALDLIITGGESGPKSRVHWVPNTRSIVQQCQEAGVAVFVKQMGANVQDRNDAGFDGCGPTEWNLADELDQVEHNPNGYLEEHQGAAVRVRLRDRKGGDMAEWPEDLRIREYPHSHGGQRQ